MLRMNKVTKGIASVALSGVMVAAFGPAAAFGATASSYWTADGVAATSAAKSVDGYLTTYGVRAGSAGPDFLGISNVNFDFQNGSTGTAGVNYTNYGIGESSTTKYTDLNGYYGAPLAIWASNVNENPNPYYWNLYYNAYSETKTATQATTWMWNSNAWGDSDGTTTTRADGSTCLVGLEYYPDMIIGANKTSNWETTDFSGTLIGAAAAQDAKYNPTFVNNDYTNVWTQIYSEEQIAKAADKLTATNGKTTRYGKAADSALSYEKGIKGQMLYVASKLDADASAKKTVAYLYGIDADGNAYFFTPEADGLVYGANDAGKSGTNSATTANSNYASNNSTVNMGYMATLPFVTNTYTGVDKTKFAQQDIVMGVESLFKNNPAIKVTDASDLANVDVIIYNSSTLTTLDGTSNGGNSSKVCSERLGGGALTADIITNWLGTSAKSGLTLIAGDDYGTSTKQAVQGTAATTADGYAPILYCKRNYTTDKNTRAAWAFSQVYPEFYGNNRDASYAYWVKNVYHVKAEYVDEVVSYMENKTEADFTDYSTFAAQLDANITAGYNWWTNTGSKEAAYANYKYYNGNSRASYFGTASSNEPANTIGIMEPSATWKAAMTPAVKAPVAQTIKVKVAKKTYKAAKKGTYKGKLAKAKSFKIGASAKTKLTYKVTKKASKKISVTKAGKVTLKKGAKKGTYKITVTAAATSSYKAAKKVITITVK